VEFSWSRLPEDDLVVTLFHRTGYLRMTWQSPQFTGPNNGADTRGLQKNPAVSNYLTQHFH
jgi:hypothetical protein